MPFCLPPCFHGQAHPAAVSAFVSCLAAGFAAAIAKGNLIAGTCNVTAGIPGTGQATTYRPTNLEVNDPIFKDGGEDAMANCAQAQ